MTEVLFYHLEQRPLEQVLPILLEKTLERDWRAVVELGSGERLEALDSALWTYRDDSFLPHGPEDPQTDAMQPVVLTTKRTNPNGASVRFFVDRALPRTEEDYQRLVFMFNGHDPDAVSEARTLWKNISSDHDKTYWQQDENGRWLKKG